MGDSLPMDAWYGTPVPGSDLSSVVWKGQSHRDDKKLLAAVYHVHVPKIARALVPLVLPAPSSGWQWGWGIQLSLLLQVPLPSSPICHRVESEWLCVVFLGREKDTMVSNLVRMVAPSTAGETGF